ncbi:MAG: DUF4192 family protein [Paeniglutamicibacter terrestris]
MNTIKATTLVEVTAVAIHGIGFIPTSSVVLMLMNENGLVATLRVDANPEVPAEEWAQNITTYVHRVSDANGVILLSFENEKAMTTAQFRALGDTLAHAGCPIKNSVLVTDGWVMDYDGDSTDAVKFSTVAESNAALALMFSTNKAAKMAADIPVCTTPASINDLQKFINDAQNMGFEDEETRAVVRGTLTDMVDGYRKNGKVSPQHAAWLAGLCTNKNVRDLMFASLATTSDDNGTISAVLMGDTAPEDWEFFQAGADAVYSALEFIPEASRTDLLAGLGWTRWIDGKGSEAMKFLGLALETDPEHRLTTLLIAMINSGELPKSASTKH